MESSVFENLYHLCLSNFNTISNYQDLYMKQFKILEEDKEYFIVFNEDKIVVFFEIYDDINIIGHLNPKIAVYYVSNLSENQRNICKLLISKINLRRLSFSSRNFFYCNTDNITVDKSIHYDSFLAIF
jgi:hypothetical protein